MTRVHGTALVTGASGFVGANLARHLLEDGADVVAVVRPDANRWRLEALADQLEVEEVDLRDGPGVDAMLVRRRPEVVFHLAAHGAYSWQLDSEAILTTNIIGTAALLEASRRAGVRRFVNAGSSSEYGFQDHAPDEHEPLAPNSTYAVAKAAAGWLARLAQDENFSTTSLRLYSVYGPFEEPERLIPQLLSAALSGALPPLNDPRVARDFVHISDVCEAFALAAESSSDAPRVFNVGTGAQTSLGDLVELVRELFGVAETPRWGAYELRSWDSPTWVASTTRIEGELGWRPRVSLRNGLIETAAWLETSSEARGRYRSVLRTDVSA